VRQNRGLYLAGAALLAVVVLFYFFDLKAPVKSPSTSPTPQPSPVLGMSPQQLQEVDIRARGKVLTLVRQGNSFTYALCPAGQSDCPAQPADASRSVQLLQSLSALRPTKVIFGAPEGLAAYGVDKPTTAEIDIKGAANQQATILVGSKSPDGSSYFIRRQDGTDVLAVAVASIDTELLGLIDSPPVPQPSPSPAAPAAGASPPGGIVGPAPPSP
jgi:hypothetical protein